MNKTVTDGTTSAQTGAQSELWQRISPASVIYFAIKFVAGIVKNGLQTIAPVAAVVATAGENRWFILSLLVAAAAVIMAIAAVLSYLNFKFRIDKDAFLIRSGVLKRKRLTLTFDRIQNVALREPLYFMPFGLVILTLESAGSSAEEVNLVGIPRPLADAIRRHVLDLRAEGAYSRPARQVIGDTLESEGITRPPVVDLLRHPPSELVRYGISNNNIWVFAGIAVGATAQTDKLWESTLLQEWFGLYSETVGAGVVAVTTGIALLVFALLSLLLSASVLGSIIVNYNYHLTYADGRYLRKRGLFERQETSVPEAKIQYLQIAQPIIARVLARFHLTIEQVGFDNKDSLNRRQKFTIPSVQPDFYRSLIQRLFGKTDILDLPFRSISTKFVQRHALYTFGVPALSIGAVLAANYGWYGLLPALVPVVMLPLILLRKRRYGYATNGIHAVVRRGLFGMTLIVFPLFKVQTIKVTQSPGQRRRGLSNLQIKLAGKTLTIPYIPLKDAQEWRMAALREIQSASRPWM